MPRILVTVMLLSLATTAEASSQEWTRQDTGFEVTYALMHGLDWAQTRHIAVTPRFRETNRILGSHPSLGEVNRYFALTLVGHAIVARILPNPYRRAWQAVWIGVEVGYVTHNYTAGVKLQF